MKKKITTVSANAWLERLVHHSPEFQTKVEEEMAAINVA